MQYFASGLGPHARPSGQPRLLILMYHRILPAEDERASLEEPGMIVTPETFRQHIEILQQYFSIVRLDDWLHKRNHGDAVPHKACAITFDDGWADNYEFAFPVLQQNNIPATIFLVSDMMGTDNVFWPERLARLIAAVATQYPQHAQHPALQWLPHQFNQSAPTAEQISATIAKVKALPDSEIHQRITETETRLEIQYPEQPAALLNWEQIQTMVDSGLISMGSHTCRHVRLNAQLDHEQLQHEILHSKSTIEQHIGNPVTTFCYPNGDLCDEALRLVGQTYEGAVTTQSGWNTLDTPVHSLHRIGVHEDIAADKTAFLARLSGWL